MFGNDLVISGREWTNIYVFASRWKIFGESASFCQHLTIPRKKLRHFNFQTEFWTVGETFIKVSKSFCHLISPVIWTCLIFSCCTWHRQIQSEFTPAEVVARWRIRERQGPNVNTVCCGNCAQWRKWVLCWHRFDIKQCNNERASPQCTNVLINLMKPS